MSRSKKNTRRSFSARRPAESKHPFTLCPVEGYVERISPREAGGWAWHPTDPSAPVEVEAVLHGAVIGRARADLPRPDVLAAGIGTGCYGFQLNFERDLARDELTQVQFRPTGSTDSSPVFQKNPTVEVEVESQTRTEAQVEDHSRTEALAQRDAPAFDPLANPSDIDWGRWGSRGNLDPLIGDHDSCTDPRRPAPGDPAVSTGGRLRVSAVLPSFNHGRYLRERIHSVVRQTHPPDEIIFVDDCSSDASVELARDLLQSAGIPFRIVTNETNSGSVFQQWMKGLQLARHPLIWIAETDDTADLGFLEKLLPAFDAEDVMLAYGHISYITEQGQVSGDLDSYYDGLSQFSWQTSITLPAYRAFSADFSLKNMIPNVSGSVFRKPALTGAELERLFDYRVSGDWYFYALLLRGGSLAYRKEAKSYFRKTPHSASRSRRLSDRHVQDHRMLLGDLAREYGVGERQADKHAQRFAALFPAEDRGGVMETLRGASDATHGENPLRICMAAYSFEVGGGEIGPIELANALKALGHHVTYLVLERLNSSTRARSVRLRLRGDIPVVYWDQVDSHFPDFLEDFGIEIFNSHNVAFEHRLAQACEDLRVPYVASLRGGYETVPELLTDSFLRFVDRNVDSWLYLSEKNLDPIRNRSTAARNERRSFNAVCIDGVAWIDREAFRRAHGIPLDAFTIVLCSRAIESKGWAHAIESCVRANAQDSGAIHLVLMGEGPMAAELRRRHDAVDVVHFMGFVDEPLRYFRCFDAAILPSTYIGESFPRFLLESLTAGLPVIATDIGEIPKLLAPRSHAGFPGAGFCISHRSSPEALVAEMTEKLLTLANDRLLHGAMSAAADAVAGEYSLERLTTQYIEVFTSLLKRVPENAPDPMPRADHEAKSVDGFRSA